AQSTFADGAVDLASVGVAADTNIECAQAGLLRIFYFGREENRAGAGAERGLDVNKFLELCETIISQQFQERAGLTSRDNEAVNTVELLGLFDQHNFSAQLFEPAAVGVEITL